MNNHFGHFSFLAMSESRASTLYFDPDIHPDDTIKAFNEFLIDFELRYEASYPDPPIMHELTLARNGIILKQERMVLPESLQSLAIELAHRGSHPGRSGIERRLRYHFFFHNMFDKVKEYVESCDECTLFSDKKTKKSIRHHKVPDSSWQTVSVDLFGPMPSSKHIVVVQDLGSRFPAAKLVSSTKADKVIPVLKDIYNAYGNPEHQISDNGPPFNSSKMQEFTESRGIKMRTTPPHFPNANPAEVFMKTVGKTMKSAIHSKLSEEDALNTALSNYRQTPHPATGRGNALS